ncbi:MAG: hypothetical protein QOI15_1876 [Pseudonocardiales bacterium]|nr:hypothetical protein [Pseudonocardiales bacterium]
MNRSARLVTAALLLLAVGWSVAPRSALPLYDGIGFPDEPYRFVQRPTGAQETQPPTTARGSAAIKGGTSDPLVAASAEVAPQLSVFIPKGRLTAPAGAPKITVTGAPVAAVPTGRGQYLWSNVYDVRISPAGAALKTGGQQATITLRSASAQRPQPHIAYYANGRWVLMPTFAQGQDIYIAELTTFGKFAVLGGNPLLVTKVSSGKSGGSGGTTVGLFVGIGVGVVVVVLFALGWLRRARARAEAPAEEESAET